MPIKLAEEKATLTKLLIYGKISDKDIDTALQLPSVANSVFTIGEQSETPSLRRAHELMVAQENKNPDVLKINGWVALAARIADRINKDMLRDQHAATALGKYVLVRTTVATTIPDTKETFAAPCVTAIIRQQEDPEKDFGPVTEMRWYLHKKIGWIAAHEESVSVYLQKNEIEDYTEKDIEALVAILKNQNITSQLKATEDLSSKRHVDTLKIPYTAPEELKYETPVVFASERPLDRAIKERAIKEGTLIPIVEINYFGITYPNKFFYGLKHKDIEHKSNRENLKKIQKFLDAVTPHIDKVTRNRPGIFSSSNTKKTYSVANQIQVKIMNTLRNCKPSDDDSTNTAIKNAVNIILERAGTLPQKNEFGQKMCDLMEEKFEKYYREYLTSPKTKEESKQSPKTAEESKQTQRLR